MIVDSKFNKYNCPKCGHNRYKLAEARMVGGIWSKIFNVQTRKFTTITCERCTYTEFYESPTRKLSNIIDFLAG
ncbi:MAG: zinc ribbon domain-containing protein [Cyclobacteriaceae bacterium]|nr:zinc ribbon domain-containing protein [Cyclobacteriaceae bacterium]